MVAAAGEGREEEVETWAGAVTVVASGRECDLCCRRSTGCRGGLVIAGARRGVEEPAVAEAAAMAGLALREAVCLGRWIAISTP